MNRLRSLRVPAVLVVLAFSAAACSRSSPSMLDHRGPEAREVASVWWLMFALAAVVYVAVAGLIFFALFRGRRRGTESRLDDGRFVVLGGIVAPAVVLAILAVVTVTTTRDLRNPSRGELRIEVTGERWWWDVRYPDAAVRTANEIHIPVGRPIDVTLVSHNVVHSFWVPQLAGKVDLIPGQANHLRFRASKPGVYLGECAEFCGIQHARMDFLVIAEEPTAFERWLSRRRAVAPAPSTQAAAEGERVFMREACAGCHTIRGTQAVGALGPDLTDFGARRWIGAVTVRNTPSQLATWIRDSQHAKPGNLMPPFALDDEDIDALVAYLQELR